MKTLSVFRAFAVCAALCLTATAQASTVAASAVTDWSQFSITGLDVGFGTPAIAWSFQDTTVSMQAFAQVGPDAGSTSQFSTINNWTTTLQATGAILGTHANATGDGSQLGAQSSNGAGFAFTSASASRGGSFSVIGTGLVMFSLPYELSGLTAIDPGAAFSDSGSASGQISMTASAFAFAHSSSVSDSVFGNSFAGFPGDLQSFSISGILFAVLSVQDGATGLFSVNASTNSNAFLFGGGGSPVPLPAAVWLLASALLGLLGFRLPQCRRAVAAS